MQAQLIITMEDNGTVNVNGPINNKVLAYGLLAVAHDAIKDFNDQQKKSGIITAVPPNLIPINGGKPQ